MKPAESTVDVTVVQMDSSVSGTAADITWGAAGSVEVTVTPSTATGTVELYDGTTLLGDAELDGGGATIAIEAGALAVGDHTLTLKYLGDDDHDASESTVDVTVVKASSTVSGTAADITWGRAGSVSVTVTPAAATGTVELYNGSTRLGQAAVSNGSVTIPVAAQSLAVGNHTLTLTYLGNGQYKPSSSDVAVKVVKAATTVSGTGTSLQWAKAGSVAVTVAPTVATGTVELYDGATKLGQATLSGGSASIPLAARSLEVGSHTLVVKYVGSATHAASQGTVGVTVTKAKPKVNVAKPEAIKAGEKAKIKVTVVPDGYDATGQVRIVLKGAGETIVVKEAVVDGKAVARVEGPRGRQLRVTATYLGDEHTLRGEDDTRLRVK